MQSGVLPSKISPLKTQELFYFLPFNPPSLNPAIAKTTLESKPASPAAFYGYGSNLGRWNRGASKVPLS